jgi:hypothetical protein
VEICSIAVLEYCTIREENFLKHCLLLGAGSSGISLAWHEQAFSSIPRSMKKIIKLCLLPFPYMHSVRSFHKTREEYGFIFFLI